MSSTPPPIPVPLEESAWQSYFRTVAIVLPAAIFLGFWKVFLFPKVSYLWEKGEVGKTAASWFMETTVMVGSIGTFVVSAILLAFVLLEVAVPWWPRRRAWSLTIFAALFNIFVLTTVTMSAIGGFLAVPLVIQKAKTSASQTP